MPKTPMDYSKCCIYKIEHFENESLVYVGHTTNFDKRKAHHKSSCKNENNKKFNFKLYQMIRENGGFDRFKMIEVEKYPCKDKREAERRENEVMKELKASMNTYKSFLTEEERKEYNKEYKKEYYETNKEKIQEYYETNKEKLQERMKEYRENNKEKIQEYGKEYYETNKEKLQEYRENNKEKIQEYGKEYYETNKDMIRKRINAKITCKCGSVIIRNSIKRHERNKKHINLMNQIQ
jgi:hypothetical protein